MGAGPATWSHSLLPDQHSFRGSYGGWVFPLVNHAGEGVGHFLAPPLLPGLAAAYGEPVTPQETFDVILALLSATSYTLRFGRDLEDDFPHVPFPADLALFRQAVAIGSRIRALQAHEPPHEDFRNARLDGRASGPTLEVPTPKRAWAGEADAGAIALRNDRSLQIVNVPERVWTFSVSGYQVLYRWLRARNGEALDRGLQRAILDTVGRIAELISLCDEADAVLVAGLDRTLGRAILRLPARNVLAEPEAIDEPA